PPSWPAPLPSGRVRRSAVSALEDGPPRRASLIASAATLRVSPRARRSRRRPERASNPSGFATRSLADRHVHVEDAACADDGDSHALTDPLRSQERPKLERVGDRRAVEREDDVADEQRGRRRACRLDFDDDERGSFRFTALRVETFRHTDLLRADSEVGERNPSVTDDGI